MRTKMLVLPILLLLASGLHSDTIHIPSEYSTIQAGLNAAQAGDTVLVAPETYIENLMWPAVQGIKLLSESGASSTTIDGGLVSPVVWIDCGTDTTTVIEGFTIQNGSYGGITTEGAGILLLNSGGKIRNNVVQNCAGTGIGFNSTSGDDILIIECNVIQFNATYTKDIAKGGGIRITNGSVVISGNTITSNIAHALPGTGGGIWIGVEYPGENMITIVDNIITDNEAGGGGGITISYGSNVVVFSGNQISENEATWFGHWGGGIAISSVDSLTIEYCEIQNNIGDGIRCMDCGPLVEIHQCNIVDNTEFGVYSDSLSMIDATYCWWGDPSGPGGFGPGIGDEVSEYILYDPWLTEMGIENTDPCSPLELSVFPNPFSSNAVISFELPSSGQIIVQVFDLSGRMVKQVFSNMLEAGDQTIELDGSEWSSGIYLIRLNTGNNTVSQRCILVR